MQAQEGMWIQTQVCVTPEPTATLWQGLTWDKKMSVTGDTGVCPLLSGNKGKPSGESYTGPFTFVFLPWQE